MGTIQHSKCHIGTQVYSIKQAIYRSQLMRTIALNAPQEHNSSYQQAIYRSQMMGMIRPAFQNRVSCLLSYSKQYAVTLQTKLYLISYVTS